MAKVVAAYGGKTWIQHSGYVLRGATSGVVANSATKTGGNDTHTLTVNEMPSHTHTQNAHNHQVGVAVNNGVVSNNVWYPTQVPTTMSIGDPNDGVHKYGKNSQSSNKAGVVSSTTAVNNNTGGGQAFSVLENYKSVYIWERVA
jgi:microcystin-dependent protein